MKQKKMGIALGGGGILGVAHIGVLEVLEEQGITPAVVTGTSAGSIVGALYAAGVKPPVMRELSLSLNKEDIFTWNFNLYTFVRFLFGNLRDMASLLNTIPRALFSGKKIGQLVEMVTKKDRFSEISVPFGVVAVDLITGKRVVFSNTSPHPKQAATIYFPKAPLGMAVEASCAIPGVFNPVSYQGTLLSDGGLIEMVPASLASTLGSHIVVGVDLKQKGAVEEPQSLIQVVQRGIDIMALQGVRRDLESADLVISPMEYDGELDDFSRVAELLERGRQAALVAIPDLKRLLL